MQAELIKAGRVRAWELPAVANFILGGAGAGLYLLISVLLLMGARPSGNTGLLSAALVGLGFLSVSLESGRPWRGMYLFSNLRDSWMSIEILSGAFFIAAAILDRFMPSPVLKVTAASAAFELVMSHGFMLYRARAMSAWNVPVIPFLFLSSGLVLGGAAVLVLSGMQLLNLDTIILKLIIVCLLADIAAWGLYAWLPRSTPFRIATAVLRRPVCLVLVTGLGHLFPLVLLLWLTADAGVAAETGSRHMVIALTGFCMAAGGAVQKAAIIMGANYVRGVTFGMPDNIGRKDGNSVLPGTGRHTHRFRIK